ncbi:MAG: protein BatD [Paludibacteraceae bacterium]|nr:protein BatD [Paludibacteraceae bacterium]
MKHYFFLTYLLLLVSSTAFANDEVKFTASALENVVVGQQFRLTYTVNQEAKDFRAPDLSQFSVIMGPSTSRSSSYQIINGKTSATFMLTYTYVLSVETSGEYLIQPANITVNSQRYASNVLKINVLAGNSSTNTVTSTTGSGQSVANVATPNGNIADDQLFVRQTISKKSVYEQEALVVTYKLYTRYDVGDISNAKFPDFKGFFAQEIELPKERQFAVEKFEGINYNTIVLKQYLLYPQRAGNISIDKSEVQVILRIPTNTRSRGFFGLFENMQEVKKVLKTPTETIRVKALPNNGKSSSFLGAVGDFSVKTTLSKSAVQVNEAVSLKITISGNGNLRLLQYPTIKFPLDMEVYDPKVKNKFSTTSRGTVGTKELEYIMIPRFAGTFEIPSTTFSYFDTKSYQYKAIITPTYTLVVDGTSTDTTKSSVAVSLLLQEKVKVVGDDIRFIDTDNTLVMLKKSYLFGTAWFWANYVVFSLLFLLLILLLQKKLKENADVLLVRNKKANQVANKRFKLAYNHLQKKDEKAFYEEIMKALWGYLSDKLSLSNVDLLKDNVQIELLAIQVSESTVQETLSVLHDCESARYSPTANTDQAMERMYQLAIETITKLENEIK